MRTFGTRLLYTEREPLDAATEEQLGVDFRTLPELLAASSIVSLHVPLTAETRGLLSERELALMQPGALLINTSRGDLVDEAALRAAIERGHLGGAGLDALHHEAAGGNPFGDLSTVIVTPHIAGVSRGALAGIQQIVVENVTRFAYGEAPLHVVPPPPDSPHRH